VKAEMARLAESFPGMKYQVAFTTSFVEESLAELIDAVEAIALVVLVIYFLTRLAHHADPRDLIGTFAFVKAFDFRSTPNWSDFSHWIGS